MAAQEELTESDKKICILCSREFDMRIEYCPDDGTLLTPLAKDPRPGDTFAERYEIIEIIGDGGMGKVFKARHNLMKRLVAIKMLLPHLVRNAAALKRFQQEAQAASALNHPHILYVHDFGISKQGIPYLVMDYLEGVTLSSLLKANGRLPASRALPIFTQACTAFAHAHQKGVIHRDIKPSNLMLIEYDGQADYLKVVDFGIAKLLQAEGSEHLTQTGEVFGSPLYMSPEQCRGQEMDARSDIYSLGCVLYCTLTGASVVTGRDAMECMFKQVNDVPTPFSEVCPELQLSERLESAVFKAIAKAPQDRYGSMLEFREALEAIEKSELKDQKVAPEATQAKPAAIPEIKNESSTDSSSRESVGVAAESNPAAEDSPDLSQKTTAKILPDSPAKETSGSEEKETSEAVAKTSTGAAAPVSSRKKALFASTAAAVLLILCGAFAVIKGLNSGRNDSATQTDETKPDIKKLLDMAEKQIAAGKYKSAQETLSLAAGAGNEQELLSVLPAQARLLSQAGQMTKAREVWTKYFSIEKKHSAGPVEMARAETELALSMLDDGKTDEAEPLLKQAEAVLSKAPSAEQAGLSDIFRGLSKLAVERGNYPEAVSYLKEAVNRRTKSSGSSDNELIQYYQDLSTVYILEGKLSTAQSYANTALKLADTNLGTESPAAAESYKLLGVISTESGQLAKAETLFKKALEIKSNRFGEENIGVAEIMSSLAMLYTKERKFPQADKLFQKALEIRIRELGADSPQVKRTNELYARLKSLMKK